MDARFPTVEDLDVLLARGPRVVRTVAGPVEYAEAGEGPVLMSVHGSGVGGATPWAGGGVRGERVPGDRPVAARVLRHPAGDWGTYVEQADALAALLDVLGIEQSAALGFSGGGPPTYLLAVGTRGGCPALWRSRR